jgi:hypothetical protein
MGFGFTLKRLAGLVRRKTAPATVGDEGGGGRPRQPQCRRAGESTGQCACTGVSKGAGGGFRGARTRVGAMNRGTHRRALAVAMAGAGGGSEQRPCKSEKGRCVRCREGLMVCMRARWIGRLGSGVWGAARGRGDGAHVAARPSATRARAGVRACRHEAVGVTTRIFGEENPTPYTLVIVPGSVAIMYRTHYRIISYPYNEIRVQNIIFTSETSRYTNLVQAPWAKRQPTSRNPA